MDKDKIMNYWDQLAHLTFLCHADNIMHRNETGYPLLVQQILHIQFATVSDPHGKPLCFFKTKHTLGALTYVYLSVLQSVTLPFRIIQEVLTSFYEGRPESYFMIGDMESTLLIDAAYRANFDLPQIPEPDGSYVLNQKL